MKMKDLNKKDLMELLNYINEYKIEFREKIDIPDYVTFGTEIEFQNVPLGEINKEIKKELNWSVKDDISVTHKKNGKIIGGEIISPILTDTKEKWEELKKICHILKDNNAQVSQRCGGHIHIGSNVLEKNPEYFKNFLKLWYTYEDILYRFSTGEDRYIRKSAYHFAKSIREIINNNRIRIDLIKTDSQLKTVLYHLTTDRYKSVNFSNTNGIRNRGIDTIEFRCPNGSIEETIWQNNVNTFTKTLLYSKSDNFDQEFINFKFYEKDDCNMEYFYFMDIQRALEFADLVFEKEIDKMNFLRQYFKDFDLDNNKQKFLK